MTTGGMPPPPQHGGRRSGKLGSQYSNRRDLQQAPRAATGQTYGDAKAQLQSQRLMPLPQAPSPGAAPGGVAATAGMMGSGAGPGPVPSLTAPTARPNEPLTAGLPTGPGPGPEVLRQGLSDDENTLALLRGLYQAYPNSDIARLITAMAAKVPSNEVVGNMPNYTRPGAPAPGSIHPQKRQGGTPISTGVGRFVNNMFGSGTGPPGNATAAVEG